MVNKKICMLGDFSVGKTSLTTRFVKNIFSEKYLSTVGVKVDTKEIKVDKKTTLKLMIWDIAGKDKFTTLDDNYLRGSAGYLLVADGTRPQTIETAFKLQVHMADKFGDIPFCMLVNKCDLKSDWEYSDKEISMIKTKGWSIFETSAKSGENVDNAFFELGQKLIV